MKMPWILNMPGFLICQGYIWFWIKFSVINIWQSPEYAWGSEYASVSQGSAENGPSYSSGSQYAWAWIYKGCEYVKVKKGSV